MVTFKLAKSRSRVEFLSLFATAFTSLLQNLNGYAHLFNSEIYQASPTGIFSSSLRGLNKETTEKNFFKDWLGKETQLDVEEGDCNSADYELPLHKAWYGDKERHAVGRASDNVACTTAMFGL